ncbi:uncharacterized protein EAE97_006987 [Botrytis byssoidea]|uniref:Uncharacterized protein n=1 Tax=Botrytis byssoidea TaxID=139641 RepID=A0A9P5IQG2_9HELO|nr:uncharacterized protein EAE97_006987 [Botrytis byssoidea]KAF7940801.1 hypothetical protein EAE97_006987 [Botrytis byssoidea]
MESSDQGYLEYEFSVAGQQHRISDLPFRTRESQETSNLPHPQHSVLIEYRIANETLGTRLLSMGVLSIHESDSYSDLLAAIKGKSNDRENVPLICKEKSIAIRWKIGQAVNDDSYDTLCGPDVIMNRLIRMMRERHWKDRLVVVYHAEENDSSDSSKSSNSGWTRVGSQGSLKFF